VNFVISNSFVSFLVMQYRCPWEGELLGSHGSYGVLREWKRKCCWQADEMGMVITVMWCK